MHSINVIRVLCAVCIVTAKALPINDDPSPVSTSIRDSDDSKPISRIPATMSLPSNATSIRADITDTFSCAGKIYGYYADVDNDCQIFHICLPVTYADGKENMFRWSFVCPDETIFSQELFTCIRPADWSSDCSDSGKFVELNRQFGSAADADDDNHIDDASAGTLRTAQPAANLAEPVPTRDVEVEVKSNAIDAQPDESQVSPVNVLAQPSSFDASAAAENLPVFDAISSETQSFGFFKVDDSNESPLGASADSTAAEAASSDGISVHDTAVVAPIQTVDKALPSLISAAVDAMDTDINNSASSSHLEPVESTELWNHFTESPYDGGSTIDDNVEVNAILDTDEKGSSTTDAFGIEVAKPLQMGAM